MEKKINFEAKKVILIIFGILLISFVYADTSPSSGSIPPIPDYFIGNVTINGQNALVGTQISIYVDSALESVYSISEVGKYDLFVTTGKTGNLIEFKISDILAGNATRGWGNTTYLDLSITTTPTSSDSSGGSGGGGGGGGGGSPSITSISPSTNDSIQAEENTTQTPETGEQEETGLGITGAVIGFLGSGKGIVAVIVVIVLGIGVILIKFKAPKWKRKFS